MPRPPFRNPSKPAKGYEHLFPHIDPATGNYRQMHDGVEISLAAGVALKPGNAIAGEVKCCRCGLVHVHRYRITKRGTLKLTAWRKRGKR